MTVSTRHGKSILLGIGKVIQENKSYLSEVDGLIGDGDHGINMSKGFTLFSEKVAGQELNFSEALNILGRTLMEDIGGSMGPLYGTFFMEMAKQIKDLEEIDQMTFGRMLDAALAAIKALGNAQVGDKTMIDCLEPAVAAYHHALKENKSFDECLAAMKTAAGEGRDSTICLVAKLGRASRLGERSRGVLDAGAASCCLILCTMADAIMVSST
ncbi:MAG: dihydroxyacetone kinase subunit DhaL [Clostridia bacterium]